MPPHETLFLQSTGSLDIHYISHNDFLRFQTWDFGGDLNLNTNLNYYGKIIPIEKVFKNCSSLIYVIDAQEDDYEDSLPKVVEAIAFAHRINPNIHFEVFLHKLDGYFMSEETKSERQQVLNIRLPSNSFNPMINLHYRAFKIMFHQNSLRPMVKC